MKYRDTRIGTVSELIGALKRQRRDGRTVWFRGHAKGRWELVPSLARKAAHLGAENALLKRFMQNAVPHLQRLPTSEWEWMFLMQHHRAPTRLLDWSENPLAALYFCVSEKRHMRSDGVVWCLDPVGLNDRANVSFAFTPEIPAFGLDDVLDNYLPSRVDQSTSPLLPIAIMGPRNTARMAAQLGVFTVNHRNQMSIDQVDFGQHVWRWIVPANRKQSLQEELKMLGLSDLTLFPELDRVADLAKELLR